MNSNYCGKKRIHHKNGDITTECPTCCKRQRHPDHQWTIEHIGGDAYGLICPNCDAKQLKENTKGTPQP